jgi:DEAD/DEAH box helicase domain-containing protein
MPRAAGPAIDAVGFDIETTGLELTDIVTVACAWSPGQEAHCFFGEDFSPVADMLDRARRIYTFNGIEFDLPRFAKHCGRSMRDWAAKTVDPLYMMKTTMGYGACTKLNELLKENGLDPKSASGLQAIAFWEQGDLESLRSYCNDDAKLTYALCTQHEIHWMKRWNIKLGESRVMAFQRV